MIKSAAFPSSMLPLSDMRAVFRNSVHCGRYEFHNARRYYRTVVMKSKVKTVVDRSPYRRYLIRSHYSEIDSMDIAEMIYMARKERRYHIKRSHTPYLVVSQRLRVYHNGTVLRFELFAGKNVIIRSYQLFGGHISVSVSVELNSVVYRVFHYLFDAFVGIIRRSSKAVFAAIRFRKPRGLRLRRAVENYLISAYLEITDVFAEIFGVL